MTGGGAEPSREDDFTVTGDELDLCLARAEAAEARVVELTAALRFYAQQSNYWYDETCVPMRGNEGDVLGDNGERARAALAAAGEGGK